jgi:nifR3 family TIM-barrel protein
MHIEFGFWKKLQQPMISLAPMADVTDSVFRQIIAKYSRHGKPGGGPDVFWTEFVSADGLVHPVARKRLAVDLRFKENERPIVAQLFSHEPKAMFDAVLVCKELGFDGVDINMGCPERTIVKQGAGCGLIQEPEQAQAIIRAAKEAAGDMPISVKTRIGFNKNEIETWIPALLATGIPVLTVHLRTRKDMSKVPAKWHLMNRIVEIRDEISPETLIFGNGDVVDLQDAHAKIIESGCDGAMLGRAIFGNPWLFDSEKGEVSVQEKLTVMLEHTKLYVEMLGEHKNFNIMKKHYKAYCNGFPGAKELRNELMLQKSYEDIEKIVGEFLKTHVSEI